jgi:1-acyl-sn-glycerol-3-phosphate acyltransferase
MSAAYTFFYLLLWPFFNLLHPCRAIGREHIPEGGALICANHTCLSDPLFVVFAFQKKNRLRFMAKSELMRVPVLGWLLAKAGVFGVDRGKSDVGAIKQALKVLKGGERLMLFPEGTRFKEGDGGAAKTGAAMLALRTGVPIVPVYIPREKKWFGRTPVIIGEPYYPGVKGQRATPEDYRAVADDLMARIHALGEQIKV